MKKEMTKGQLRAALCYLVGWLTENSTQRKVAGMREICSEFKVKEDADAAMQVFRAMLTKGWAVKHGCNCAAIYTSTCTTPKLDGDDAVTAAVEELMPFIGQTGKPDGYIREADTEKETESEKCENPSGNQAEKCDEPFSIPWDAIKGVAKSSPEILVTMLRDEGWTVTAKKTITIEKEL